MADKAWKAWERTIARFFGAQRNRLSGSSGRADCSRSDSTHPSLYIEAKYRKVQTSHTLWRDTRDKAKAEGKVPVVALVERRGGCLLGVKLENFDALLVERMAANPELFYKAQAAIMARNGE